MSQLADGNLSGLDLVMILTNYDTIESFFFMI